MYIFDVDGVINDIQTYTADTRVLKQINNLLDSGCYVALNTGRGYDWVEVDVIQFLQKQPDASDKLDRIFVSAEMGGLTVSFSGGEEYRESTAFSLLPQQIARVKQLYEQYGSSGAMHWYAGKLSMATIDKPAGIDPRRFLVEGKPLVSAIEKEFADEHVKINHNPDAIDVMTPEAGKWAGAQLIYDWVQRTSAANSAHFICFGDNDSDYEMARFFGRQGHKVDFVFTGEALGEDIEHDPGVNLIKTDERYNDGTYAFLRQHNGLKETS